MQRNFTRHIALAGCLVIGLLTGCLPAPEGVATDVTGQTAPPVTLTATPDLSTPIAAVPSPSPSPFTFPATLAVPSICAGAPPTRLILGERARISDEDPTDLNVRAEPGATKDNPPIGKLRVGEVVIVMDGPVCSDRYTWYEVDTGDLRGWIAEGDLTLYYIDPFLGQ